MRSLFFSFFLLCFLTPVFLYSQVSDATINNWAIAFKSIDDLYGDKETSTNFEVWTKGYRNVDTATLLLQRVLKSSDADLDNNIFRFRIMMMRLVIFQADTAKRGLAEAKPLADSLLLLAYQTANDGAIAWASWFYGSLYYMYQDLETAATFYSGAVQKFDEGPVFAALYSMHCVLGEIMFHAGEYKSSISNTLKGLPHIIANGKDPQNFISRYYNTIGQAYQRLNMPDSALYYFNTSTKWATEHQDSTWVSINALNIGEIFMGTPRWQQAKALFYEAYSRNKEADRAMEANARLALGNWYLKNGQMDSSQWFLTTCLQTSLQYRTADNRLRMDNYRRRVLDAISGLYLELGKPRDFYRYQAMYRTLNDSLNKVALLSSIKSVELRNKAMNDEQAVARLQKEKRNERWLRNLIIFGILILSVSVIVYLNRQRKVLQLQQQADQLKQQSAARELEDARRQLEDFTQRLHEKTLLLDRLKEQATTLADQDEYLDVVEELTQQTILTEDDWQKFRSLFEKIEPEFFPKLRRSYPEITVAEMRIAALTLLQIDNRQMAAMLGISADSVRKSRQRLRQRLQVGVDTDLYQLLSAV